MKPWPRMREAVADWHLTASWTVDERLDHFHQNYPERLGHISTWEGIKYVLQNTRRYLDLHSKLGEVPEAPLVYHNTVPELRFPFEPHLAVLSDLHASAHDSRGVALFLRTIEALGIKTVVLNGDEFDNAYLGHKGVRDSRAPSAAENLHQAATIFNGITRAGVERVYAINANHNDKPLRNTDGELLYTDWWTALVAPLLEHPDRFTVTHRYYCIMDAMSPQPEGFAPEHFPTRFTHQKNYGSTPFVVGQKLANKFFMNIVTGHQHHLGFSRHLSGKVMIADAGTMQFREGASYKVNRDTCHSEWCPGFLTLHWGVPRIWPLDAPDEWWAWQLGLEDADELG